MSDPQRDPALDAAWRASSTELPPAHLDAAILAAARREVKSKPKATGDDDALAEAREPSRWWWGLAAAATIGAVAFGVVQLAPPVVPATESPVATDMPADAPGKLEPKRVEPTAKERERPSVAPQAVPAPMAPVVPAPDPVPVPAPPPAPAAEPRAFPGAPPLQAMRKAERDEPGRAQADSALGASAAGNRATARESTTPSPQVFIDRIRRLYDDSRLDEAAAELRAFRAAYVDADARLPVEMRDWARSVAR